MELSKILNINDYSKEESLVQLINDCGHLIYELKWIKRLMLSRRTSKYREEKYRRKCKDKYNQRLVKYSNLTERIWKRLKEEYKPINSLRIQNILVKTTEQYSEWWKPSQSVTKTVGKNMNELIFVNYNP